MMFSLGTDIDKALHKGTTTHSDAKTDLKMASRPVPVAKFDNAHDDVAAATAQRVQAAVKQAAADVRAVNSKALSSAGVAKAPVNTSTSGPKTTSTGPNSYNLGNLGSADLQETVKEVQIKAQGVFRRTAANVRAAPNGAVQLMVYLVNLYITFLLNIAAAVSAAFLLFKKYTLAAISAAKDIAYRTHRTTKEKLDSTTAYTKEQINNSTKYGQDVAATLTHRAQTALNEGVKVGSETANNVVLKTKAAVGIKA